MATAMSTEGTSSSWLRGETRKKPTAFLLRALLFVCVAFRVAVALIRVLYHAAAGSVLGVARVLFAAANERCLRGMDRAALGRGSFFAGAMANSWRVLMQGLASLMFLCARADEYVRQPPSPLVLTDHDKPAAHPQQVHISTVGRDKMRISWVTDDRSTPSVVEYGKSRGNYTASATGGHATYKYFFYESGAIHHVTIGPLAPGTTYHYRCGKAGDELTLRTPPASLPIELVVTGDLGQTRWTASTLAHIGGADYDMLLLPGDLSYADTQQPLWDSFGRLVQPLASARPWMVTEGNHEAEALPVVGFAPFVAYNARWRMPHEESGSASNLYYSFDAAGGAAHVVMLGSYAEFEEGSEQRAWLERDLAGVDRRRTPWLLVLLHAPWYNTNQAHQGEGEAMRAAMEALLYEARVDVVFSGHVHAYERFVSQPYRSSSHLVVFLHSCCINELIFCLMDETDEDLRQRGRRPGPDVHNHRRRRQQRRACSQVPGGSQVSAPVGVPGGELWARPAENRRRDERRLDVAPQRRRIRHRPRRGLVGELG
ncbi:hypothetical protein VPH35_032052 [Triticum aestivum]